MKIALIGRYGKGEIIAGPERFARELFKELKNQNQQVVFIEYFFSGYKYSSIFKKLFGKEEAYNNTIIRLGIVPFLLTLHSRKFDVLHIVNSQRFIIFLLVLNPFFSVRIITTLHGFIRNEIPTKNIWTKRDFIDIWVEKLLIKKSSLIIFPSSLLLSTFRQFYNITVEKNIVIHNGISGIFFEQQTVFPSIENTIKLVFYNGSNNAINRGLDKLLELMNNLKYEFELYVIGDKVEVKYQKNIRIIFADPMSQVELINFVSDKHFIIKSSAADSFSILIAECMALGVIPIISENIGIKDVIIHGENGFIYNSSSSIDLATLMNEIYQSKYDLNQISANARKTSGKLTWEKITEEYISVYKSIL